MLYKPQQHQLLINGKLRENDLPAMELANGDKFWYINGKLHWDGGLPAGTVHVPDVVNI
jgi:hypothetical protein